MDCRSFYDRSDAFGQVVRAQGGPLLRIAITVDERLCADPAAQAILSACCNLLPRVTQRYTNIDLLVPDTAVTIPGCSVGPLREYLLRGLNATCPWGSFRTVERLSDPYDFCIVVGSSQPLTAKHIIN